MKNLIENFLSIHRELVVKFIRIGLFRSNEDNIIINYVSNQLYALIEKGLKELQRNNRIASGDSDKQETQIDTDDVDNSGFRGYYLDVSIMTME